MANARIIITKNISFRGQREVFSNGYTFQADAGGWSSQQWIDLINAVKDVERAVHSTSIQFVSGAGAPQGQPTAEVVPFNNALGLYAPAGATYHHPEVCVLAQAPVARGRVLAKYYHIGQYAAATMDDPGAQVARVNAILAPLTNGTLLGTLRACAPNGDLTSGPFTVDAYLRTHQFHQGRRRPQA